MDQVRLRLQQVDELAQVIVVEWNPRFTRRLGDAAYNSITFRARIRLSSPLWPRTSEEDRRETVIHEACHIIVGYKFGQVAAPHGSEWKEAMRNCGVEPLRDCILLTEPAWLDDSGGSFSSIVLTRGWSESAAARPGSSIGCDGERRCGARSVACTWIGSRLSKRIG